MYIYIYTVSGIQKGGEKCGENVSRLPDFSNVGAGHRPVEKFPGFCCCIFMYILLCRGAVLVYRGRVFLKADSLDARLSALEHFCI